MLILLDGSTHLYYNSHRVKTLKDIKSKEKTMVAIITDSSSNISAEEGKKLGVVVIPLTIIFGTEEYRDGVDIDCDTFYDKLTGSKEFPHTAQLGEDRIEEAVESALKTADEAIIMPISSALSGSYERCVKVAQKYENLYVYDTKCTTVMLKTLVLEARALRGLKAAEIIKKLDELRPKLKLFAVLDTIEYLGKGGRISKAAAALGTVLKIKPVVTVNSDGEVEVISKQFGMSKGIKSIAERVDKSKIDYSKPVYLIYTMDDKNSLALIDKIAAEYTEKENICPVIGTHIGPCAAGFAYAEK